MCCRGQQLYLFANLPSKFENSASTVGLGPNMTSNNLRLHMDIKIFRLISKLLKNTNKYIEQKLLRSYYISNEACIKTLKNLVSKCCLNSFLYLQ